MPLLSRAASFFQTLLGRRRLERELDEELHGCLDVLVSRYQRDGLSAEQARRRASLELGGIEQVKEEVRGGRVGNGLVTALRDVRFAVRVLTRDRRFATMAILVLGLGLGVNTTLFTILNAICLRGLPIAEVGRVFYISTVNQAQERGVSFPELREIRAAATHFEAVAAFLNVPLDIAERGRPAERVQGAYVSGQSFALLREEAVLGRALTVDDDRVDAPPVAVIGSRLWTSRFAADPGVLGRPLELGDRTATIVGVMKDGFEFPGGTDVWLPLSLTPGLSTQPRDARTLGAFGRLASHVSPQSARAQVEAVFGRLAAAYPDTHARIRARVVPINERYNGRLTDPAWLAFLTVGLVVVLIACANVANLMLAWSVGRTREIAIRSALGASRARIVRQLLMESALLAAAGGLVGLLIALALLRLFTSAIPERALPYWIDFSIDHRVLICLGVTAVATLFVFGLTPALRVSKLDVNRTLKDGGLTGTPRSAQRWTTAFLAVQFALTMLLVAHVVLSVRASAPPLDGDVAVEHSRALTAAIEMTAPRYAGPPEQVAFVERLLAQLAARPTMEAVAAASVLPLQGGPEERLEVEGRPAPAPDDAPVVRTVAVTPAYFETFALPLLRGRTFATDEGTPGREAVVVNRRFVDLHFPRDEPIGRRIRLTTPGPSKGLAGPWLTIVGVSPTVRQRRAATADPVVYLPYRTAPTPAVVIAFRARGDHAIALAALREETAALDPTVPIVRAASIRQVLDDAQWNGRVSSGLMRAISAVALLLALAGLYTVTAHGVSQRVGEIAIRLALGAQSRDVRRTVLAGTLRHIVPGLAVGLLCSVAWDAVFYSGQPGLRLADWRVLLPATIFLGLLALAACWVPAARASRLSPLTILRRAG